MTLKAADLYDVCGLYGCCYVCSCYVKLQKNAVALCSVMHSAAAKPLLTSFSAGVFCLLAATAFRVLTENKRENLHFQCTDRFCVNSTLDIVVCDA